VAVRLHAAVAFYVVALPWLGLLVPNAFLGRQRMLKLLIRESAAMFGRCSVALHDDTLSCAFPYGRIEIPWEWLDDVEEAKGSIVISRGLIYVIRLPRDALADPKRRPRRPRRDKTPHCGSTWRHLAAKLRPA